VLARQRERWVLAQLDSAEERLLAPPVRATSVLRRAGARVCVHALMPSMRLGAVAVATLGVVLVWSEVCLLLQWLIRVVADIRASKAAALSDPIGGVLLGKALFDVAQRGSSVPFLPWLLLFAPLVLLRFCVGWAQERLQTSTLALRGQQCTPSCNLLYDASCSCRLTLSLCFHYVCLLQGSADVDRHGEWAGNGEPSAFFCLYESMNDVSLFGRLTDDFYPPLCFSLLLVLCLFYRYDIWSRVLAWLDGLRDHVLRLRGIAAPMVPHASSPRSPPFLARASTRDLPDVRGMDSLRTPLLEGVHAEGEATQD